MVGRRRSGVVCVSEEAMQQGEGESPPAEPTFTAREIGERLGRGKRMVLRWFDDGCPHLDTMRGKKPEKRAKLSEVKAYLASQGLEEQRYTGKAAAAVKVRGAEGVRAVGVVGVGEVVGGKAEETGVSPGPLFDQQVSRLVEEEMRLRGSVDFGTLLSKARREFDSLLTRTPSDATTAEKERWSGALEKCERVIRRLAEAQQAQEVFRGEYILRVTAERMLVGLSQNFVSALASLEGELARVLAVTLDKVLLPATMDEARRLTVVAVKDAADKVRKNLAEEVRRRTRPPTTPLPPPAPSALAAGA